MAAFNYSRARATADRLIAKFGQPGAILRDGDGTSGDMTNSQSAPEDDDGAPSRFPCTLVIVDYSEREKDGTLIRQTDRKALIATKGLTIEPQASDRLAVGDDEYAIVSIMPLKPGPVTVMWQAQVRS